MGRCNASHLPTSHIRTRGTRQGGSIDLINWHNNRTTTNGACIPYHAPSTSLSPTRAEIQAIMLLNSIPLPPMAAVADAMLDKDVYLYSVLSMISPPRVAALPLGI